MEHNHTFGPDWQDDEPLETFKQYRGTSLGSYAAIDYLIARCAYAEDAAMVERNKRQTSEAHLAAREREIAELADEMDTFATGQSPHALYWAKRLRALLSPHPPAVGSDAEEIERASIDPCLNDEPSVEKQSQMCACCQAINDFPGGLFTIWSDKTGESDTMYHWRDNRPCGPVLPYKPAVDHKEAKSE